MNKQDLLDELTGINKSIINFFHESPITEAEAEELHRAFSSLNRVLHSVERHHRFNLPYDTINLNNEEHHD